MDKAFYSVAIYLVDRKYGGPEEGGWYYTAGELATEPEFAKYLRGFDNIDDAYDYAASVDDDPFLITINANRPSISSVLSEGQYFACVNEGVPASFPTEQPHYE